VLERNVDFVLVGKSYFSLLLGLELLDQGQKVLLLDDDRLSYGDLYSHGIGELELSLLKGWGEDRAISPLAKIDDFVKGSPLVFHSNYKRLCLGSSPSENLIEFTRKFADYFSEQEYEVLIGCINSEEKRASFDEQILGMAKRLGLNGFRFRGVQNFDTQFFQGQATEDVKDLYNVFKSKWTFETVESDNALKVFLNNYSLFLHKTFGVRFGDYQIFHGLLSILTPSYELDQNSLCQSLLTVFQRKGGQFKKTHVREWKFYKGAPWSLELASFEGIIHPRKIIFLGGDPVNVPFKLGKDSPFYKMMNVDIEFNFSTEDSSLKALSSNLQFLSKSKMLGTDHFIFSLHKISENQVSLKMLIRNKKGFKIDFIKDSLIEFIVAELDKYFPIVKWSSAEYDFSWGRELYVDRSLNYKNTGVPLFQKVSIFEKSGPQAGQSLKNVYYIGPLREGPLGVTSCLLEIKDGHQFI
tara:strand:- start:27257 stop:28660 length:1404 start_codon:yes stop_codon:yes gene_type:complete